MLKILSQSSFLQNGFKNSKNNKRNNKKKNSNNTNSMNIPNEDNNFNSGFNDDNIKNYKKYSYIMDFIDVTSKKNKPKDKNNLISADKKIIKNSEIKENININNKEIIENNKNIINDNKEEKKDNNIDNNNNNKNEIEKSKENKNNVILKIEQIQINGDDIINDENKQDTNNNANNIININENNQKKEPNSVLIKNKYQKIPKVNLKKIRNYSSCDIRKNKGKNKLKQLNSSLDDIYNNNNKKYLNIKNSSKRNQNNSIYKFRQLSEEHNKLRINELSNKLNNILNLSTYNTLIKKRQIKKAGLQTSISNLENSIKLFRKTKKKKERECMKLSDEISKLITNHAITREKLLDYDILKQKVDIENKEIQDIKEETNNINLLTKQTQKEINEMNINIQLLNKKIADENKLCEKIRKDIAFYKKHTDNLIQKLKLIYQNADIIEDAIINLEENN